MLQDTQPDQAKDLVEEKLKKVTTEKAPVAGQTPGRAGSGGRLGRQAAVADVGGGALAEALRAAMHDGGSGSSAAINEMLRTSAAGRNSADLIPLWGSGAGEGEGAAAAAGVLTAVDEDDEGAEEAKVPGEFEYLTDNEDEEEL